MCEALKFNSNTVAEVSSKSRRSTGTNGMKMLNGLRRIWRWIKKKIKEPVDDLEVRGW